VNRLLSALTCALLLAALVAVPAGAADDDVRATAKDYVVVLAADASTADAQAAVERAGGTVVKSNASIDTMLVRASSEDFIVDVSASADVVGAARNQPIGQVPDEEPKADDVERLEAERARADEVAAADEASGSEPLASLQWDMDVINATKAHHVTTASHKVRVGVMDTGIDASHPDIAANFNRRLSRNFTVDIPLVDGPCEEDPDDSCEDPADVDEDGHGTHVAGTIGSPLNGMGIAGVAPDVSLVNLRAGQDSGYFFLQPTVDALTYAGRRGIDVVNMSFYIDPWLFNCTANPADSPAEQLEQQAIIRATQRALDFAHRRGVTLVAAEGNGHTDLGNPEFDPTSPDFPPGNERDRVVDNTCLNLPTEGRHVIGVTAIGPSLRKAYYSDYGLEQADVSAPGGDYYDFPGTDRFANPVNLILAPYPEALAIANDEVDEDGVPTTPFVVRDCQDGECAYYQYLQGTSMASPHAAGVAALIVDRHGRRDWRRGGLTAPPRRVAKVLKRTANDKACPRPRLQTYPELPTPDTSEFDAYCQGGVGRNGFYGHGIVDAFRAVLSHHHR